jgi:hypothetical protein
MALQITYHAAFDDGKPYGLFRVRKDDDRKELWLERYADGGWRDAPEMVDELREPDVRVVSAREADDVIAALAPR